MTHTRIRKFNTRDKLVVAISSRALFDFEEENRVFERDDDAAYMALQLARLEQPASPASPSRSCRSCSRSTPTDAQRVEVVILSRNDPVSGPARVPLGQGRRPAPRARRVHARRVRRGATSSR
jgi:hypothetical protein